MGCVFIRRLKEHGFVVSVSNIVTQKYVDPDTYYDNKCHQYILLHNVMKLSVSIGDSIIWESKKKNLSAKRAIGQFPKWGVAFSKYACISADF